MTSLDQEILQDCRAARAAHAEIVEEIAEWRRSLERLQEKRCTYVTPVELKFAGDGTSGIFEGYGSIFNNIDSHGDLIKPGAFAASLAEHKAAGTMPGLYLEHSYFSGGADLLPAGRWLNMHEDAKGLRGRGQISALDSDYGKRVWGLMQDGALGGLSIAFNVPPNGAYFTNSKVQGEPKRILTAINLVSLDVVRLPSNPAARVDALRSDSPLTDLRQAIGDFNRWARERQAGNVAAAVTELRAVLADFRLPRLS